MYKEISKEIKSIESGLYYLKLTSIEKDKITIADKLNEQDDELSAVKIDLSHNNQLLEEENKRLAPLRDRKMETK
jgi:chromosome segregation protein